MAVPKIIYFIGCWGNYNAPDVGKALVRVMKRNQHEVIVPEQCCCGLPMMANANIWGAKRNFRRNVESLYRAAYPDGVVLTTCPSCNLMLRREGRIFFDSAEAQWISEHTLDVGVYLLQLHRQNRLAINFQHLPLRIFYKNPCHQQLQGIVEEPLELLRLLPGLDMVGMSLECCGMGGSYGMKRSNYQRSQLIAQKILDDACHFEAEAGVTECGGCNMRIREGTGLPVYHPLELLDRAYGDEGRDTPCDVG
jgi:glycerol-3-phosphate dehydrogenase subunit C